MRVLPSYALTSGAGQPERMTAAEAVALVDADEIHDLRHGARKIRAKA
jgi:hypothetical protein